MGKLTITDLNIHINTLEAALSNSNDYNDYMDDFKSYWGPEIIQALSELRNLKYKEEKENAKPAA